jgi:predicted N-acetyltransferase YhbS
MRLNFANPDFEALAGLWNDFYPERYRVDEDLLRLNTVQSPVFDWGASSILTDGGDVKGFVSIKKSASALYSGPDQDVAHLSAIAYTEPGVGVDLMSDVKRTLRNRGISRITFGQDSRHFFPGCPTDFRSLLDFLTIEGFSEGGIACDLERDLTDYQNPYPETPSGAQMRYVGPEDQAALDRFMEREFRGRWTYDVDHKVRLEGGTPTVYGLFKGSEIEGFVLTQRDGAKIPIGGAVWRSDLGPNWGSAGPLGVSTNLRGAGVGGAMLGAALAQLKADGVRRCIIDWTGLAAFYQKFGFEVSREYRSMSLNLER